MSKNEMKESDNNNFDQLLGDFKGSGITGDLIENTAITIEKLNKDQAYQRIKQHSDLGGFNAFCIGGVLSIINSLGWYKDYGHNSFKSFVIEELGISTSTAYDNINIYNKLIESEVSWSSIEHIGWTKIRLFAKCLTQQNVDEWIKVAENMNAEELREYVKHEAKASLNSPSVVDKYMEVSTQVDNLNIQSSEENVGEVIPTSEPPSFLVKEKPTMVTKKVAENIPMTRTFKLYPDQDEVVKQALEIAKDQLDTKHSNVALTNICMDFLASN